MFLVWHVSSSLSCMASGVLRLIYDNSHIEFYVLKCFQLFLLGSVGQFIDPQIVNDESWGILRLITRPNHSPNPEVNCMISPRLDIGTYISLNKIEQ